MPNVVGGFIVYLVFLNQILNDSSYGAGFDSSSQRSSYAIYWWVAWTIYGVTWYQFYLTSRDDDGTTLAASIFVNYYLLAEIPVLLYFWKKVSDTTSSKFSAVGDSSALNWACGLVLAQAVLILITGNYNDFREWMGDDRIANSSSTWTDVLWLGGLGDIVSLGCMWATVYYFNQYYKSVEG